MTTETALAPLTGDITPQEISASADAHRQAADDTAARSAQDAADAHLIMTDARAQVTKIMRSAEEQAAVLTKSADQARRQAEVLAGYARSLEAAAAELANADDAEDRAEALEAEREELAAAVAELDGKIARLGAGRGQLAAAMDTAREDGDLDGLAALRSRDSAAADIAASLTAQRSAAIARIREIGEPDWPHWPKPPLAEAHEAARGAQQAVRRTLNVVWPERPEAVLDRAREELRLTIEAQRGRIAEEAAAQCKPPEPRQFVHL